jgi:hypothetical protein
MTFQRGGRNFVGPPIRLFGGFGAGGGGVNRLMGRDAGDLVDPDFGIVCSSKSFRLQDISGGKQKSGSG